ncbi:MAG TPA: NYN domain-containing protein [Caldilineae bacterium]|nr:NYN domain-containing protein [Caldilineae bacterium]
MNEPNNHIKSALFVDFDNIYIGLKQLDEVAAEHFAMDPSQWLAWMEQGMPRGDADEHGEETPQPRDILVRRCYLNPRDFHRARPSYTRAAFNVIDCPSLTAAGKNSADIYMVMDILDTLEHDTHFDEFIILSGDADFTPVLLRLRSHDRRTVILAAGPASEAYKAACDLVIPEDVFIEYALGMSADAGKDDAHPRRREPLTPATEELLEAMASDLYTEASANGEILATDLPKLYLTYPQFRRDSHWLGFYSLRALTAELTKRNPELRITEGDPWRVTVRVPTRRKRPKKQQEPDVEVEEKDEASEAEEKLRKRIIRLVRRMVAKSDEPILMAKAAHDVTSSIGPQVIETRWAGAGTFKDLLQSAENLDFEIVTAPSPGYLYDPKRHDPPQELAKPETDVTPELKSLIGIVYQATGTPNLLPHQYAVLFRAIAADLKVNPYNLTKTSKSVRDRCIEEGESISRSNVSFVLKGIIYKGHRFNKRDTAIGLAKIYRDSVLARCEDVELKLDDREKKMVDAWIVGGLSGKK